MRRNELMSGEEVMALLVEQGYLKNEALSTGTPGVVLTNLGFEALQMLLLTLKPPDLMNLFSTTLPAVVTMRANRDEEEEGEEGHSESKWKNLLG